MTMEAALYLVPVELSGAPTSRVIPQWNIEVARQIRVWIVENVRTARRFLRRCGRRNARRADAEIIDIFRADLFGAAHGVIGDLPDGIAGRAERVYFGWDHMVFPRFTRYSTALR